MKKIIGFLLCITALASSLSLFACNKDNGENDDGEKEVNLKDGEAYTIVNDANNKMATLDSYTVSSMMSGTLNISETEITISATETEKISGLTSGELLHRKEVSSKAKSGSVTESIISGEGFCDGKMFSRYLHDGYENLLWSHITAEEYLQHYASMNESVFDELLWNDELTADSLVTHRDDGGVTVAFNNFNDAFLTEVFTELELDAYGETIKLSAVEMTYEIAQNGIFESLTLNISLDNNGKICPLTQETEFTDIDSTVVKTYSLGSYKEVEDIRLIHKADRALSEMREISKGDAVLTLDSVLEYGTTTQTYSETDTISYDKTNGLEYNLTATSDEINARIEYRDGKKYVYTIKDGEETLVSTVSSDIMTETVYLYSLLDYGMFDSRFVKGVEMLEDGSVKYTLDVTDTVKASRPAPSTYLYLAEIEVTLKFKGDGISEYSTLLEYKGNATARGALYTITANCKFD